MKQEQDEYTKVKKIRKDRKHNKPHKFDDEVPENKAAGKKKHSRINPLAVGEYGVYYHPEDFEDEPYADFIDSRLIK